MKPTFTDEQGEKLLPFSVANMDEYIKVLDANTRVTERMATIQENRNWQRWVLIGMGIVILLVALILLYAAKKDHFFNVVVQRCLG